MEPRDPLDAHDPPVDGDAVDHLWNAAHEMLGAMRTLLDAADEFVESQRGTRPVFREAPEPREGRVHHIDIDARADAPAERRDDWAADRPVDRGNGTGAM